jgi:SAM-dependent methyltransferase
MMKPWTRRTLLLQSGAACVAWPALSWAAEPERGNAESRAPVLDVPYVATPMEVVDRMLDLAQTGRNDRVYDLGSGDGRIVIRAAQRFGARGVGVDLDPQRVEEAKANAKTAGVESLVRFEVGDVFAFDFSRATVVTMYLLPAVNLRLRPRLLAELAPGTRIVSHEFDMGDWKPVRSERVGGRRVYFWTVPARQT